MTLVSPSQSNPGEEINAADINGPVNQIAAVVNGNLDDTNISSLSGTKLVAGTVPASAMATAANPETRTDETMSDFLASGCVWSAVSGLNASMTAGVVYVNGKRNAISAIASRTFTASRDTYVSVSDAGVVSYSEVTNGASMPSTPANSVFIAKVVTSGSAVTGTSYLNIGVSYNSGSFTSYTPEWTGTTTSPSIGNGTLSGRFFMVGKQVTVDIRVTPGSTTSFGSGNYRISLPVPANTTVISNWHPLGSGSFLDTSASSVYFLHVMYASATTVLARNIGSATGTTADWGATTPATAANGDAFAFRIVYEAA